MSATIAYTIDREITIPEVRFDSLPAGHTLVALRGYAYTQAVLDPNGNCVGWGRFLVDNS